jgi:NADH-quinone oxidoreductase subunit H
VSDLVWLVLPPFVLLNGVLILTAYLTLLERKFAARLQSRVGPYNVGRPHGWLQPIADGLKLMLKEDIVPAAADRVVYNLAPIVFLVPAFLMYAAIPFAPRLALADIEIGLLFVLAVSSLEVVGLFSRRCGRSTRSSPTRSRSSCWRWCRRSWPAPSGSPTWWPPSRGCGSWPGRSWGSWRSWPS